MSRHPVQQHVINLLALHLHPDTYRGLTMQVAAVQTTLLEHVLERSDEEPFTLGKDDPSFRTARELFDWLGMLMIAPPRTEHATDPLCLLTKAHATTHPSHLFTDGDRANLPFVVVTITSMQMGTRPSKEAAVQCLTFLDRVLDIIYQIS